MSKFLLIEDRQELSLDPDDMMKRYNSRKLEGYKPSTDDRRQTTNTILEQNKCLSFDAHYFLKIDRVS